MDANQQRFWMLESAEHWRLPESLRYRADRRVVTLDSEKHAPIAEIEGDAEARLQTLPAAMDAYGGVAAWDAVRNAIVVNGPISKDLPIFPTLPLGPGESPPSTYPGSVPTDYCVGNDGILYVARDGNLVLHDLNGRWPDVEVAAPEDMPFVVWRLASRPAGGVFALDRSGRAVARLEGAPFPFHPYEDYDPSVFRPIEENPNPPRLVVLDDDLLPEGHDPVAIACDPNGRAAVLTWTDDGENRDAHLFAYDDDSGWSGAVTLLGIHRPFSLKWISETRIAVLVEGVAEAVVYRIDALAEAARSEPALGDFYPLINHDGYGFCHTVETRPHYATSNGTPRPLHALSLPSLAVSGVAENARALDSGDPGTTWHRIYLEAIIPPRCALTVYVAATHSDTPPAADSEAWYPHHFGKTVSDGNAPLGVWVPLPSEIPFHDGMLPCDRAPNRAGLFTALVQRSNRRVSRLTGRFAWVRVSLTGTGRTSPEIAALRIYGSRFSYVEHYLPKLYHEDTFGPDADLPLDETRSTTTPADFFERFLSIAEGVLTPLEDRIANAHLLTHPNTVPEGALSWLASWVGYLPDPLDSPEQTREMVKYACELYPWRGTMRGLLRTLDIATGGAVTRGEVVVVENFRLRRTFATILGANFSEESDELLGGIPINHGAFVGDTLILGREWRREFLALFSETLAVSKYEEQVIEQFYESTANRISVIVQREKGPELLAQVERIVNRETPIHILPSVVAASHPLVVGLSSLVEVDTYLGRKTPPKTVRVGHSYIGVRDMIRRPPSLDPKIEGDAT